MRNLQKDAGPISRIGLAAFRAAVLQINQDLKGPANNIVRFVAGNIDNEANATRIMFKLRIVQSLFWR